jgi:hypothetical protein
MCSCAVVAPAAMLGKLCSGRSPFAVAFMVQGGRGISCGSLHVLVSLLQKC